MSKTVDTAPKKKGGMIKMIIMGVALLAAGGGGVFGLMAAGVIGSGHAEKEEDKGPKLVSKGEEDPFAAPKKEAKDGAEFVHGEGGSKYRTAYYTFSEEFTSNLRDSDAMVQLSLAASTKRDGRVLMWLKEHELAIRSRIVVELADTSEETIATPEGKRALQQRMTRAINEVLEAEEGFGGVDDVFFRSFIIQ